MGIKLKNMKASELRIGQLYKFIGDDFEAGIYPLSPSHFWKAHEYSFDVENAIEPIPLTEEWLFKFGWFYAGTCDAAMEGYYRKDGILWCLDNHMMPFCIGQDGEANYFGCPLKYVHRLQNLWFELEDEELMIAEQNSTSYGNRNQNL